MDVGAIVYGIIMCIVVYFAIGLILCIAMDLYYDGAILICASIFFWPIIILVYACKGLIKILKGE